MSAEPIPTGCVPARPQVARGTGGALDAAVTRALDVVVSALLLLVLAPLMLLVSLLVRLDSPGPCLFRCDRVGHRGRPLRMLKFRKMHDGAHGAPLTLVDDDRFTRAGRWLARLKLDELPQLWHVLRGEMSLVGPRPESASFVQRHDEDYRHILAVRPGIVGLSQLAFADEGSVLDAADPLGHYVERILPQKVQLDRLYADERTVGQDLRILVWATVAVVLRRPVAVNRQSGALGLRRR